MTHGFRIVCLTALAVLSAPAFAADKAPPPPHCGPLAELKSSGSFAVLTPGQFHFVEGIYVASPLTPPGGLPPGDGAVMIDYGHGKSGIIWTRGKTFCVTIFVTDAEHHKGVYMPMPVDTNMMAAIKSGLGEIAPSEDESQDRKL